MHCASNTAISAALALAVATPSAAQYAQPNSPYGQQPSPGGVYAPPPNQPYGQPSYGQPYGQPPPAPGAYGGPPPGTYQQPPQQGPYPAQPPAYGQPPGSYAAPAPAYGAPPAGAYGANTAYAAAPVKCDNNGAIAGGLIGALAGGVLGSNVSGHGKKTEGTVLGGLVGGGLGAYVGHAHDRHQCDERGVVYYNYNDTVPYQVDPSNPDPQAAQYVNRGCRLAPASVNGQDARYVRVCPDPDGRYRIVS